MLKIYYGRESIDKDRFIYDNISGRSVLLVPDQYTLEAEKDILEITESPGLLETEVLGFSRLSDRITDECGRSSRVPVNRYGRYMMLTDIVESIDSELGIYRGMYRKITFIQMVNDFLAQIRQNNVDAAELERIKETVPKTGIMYQKLEDMTLIYEKYEETVAERYIDTEDYVSFVISKVGESEYIKERSFWITGFDSFTPRNIMYITELMKYAQDVNIVLTYDNTSRDAHLFGITGNLITILKGEASANGVEYEAKKIEGYEVERPAGLKTLEKELYSFPVMPSDDHTGIRIVSAAGIYQEVESAASFISGLIRDEGLRYRDIAVVCNNIEDNSEVIRRTFERYEIPVFIDSGKSIADNALSIYILSMLKMAVIGINTNDVFKMLRSGYSEFSKYDIDSLENYVIEFRIRKNGWKKEFVKTSDGNEAELEKLNELRTRILESVNELTQKIDKSSGMKDAAMKIYSFFKDEKKIADKVESKSIDMENRGLALQSQLCIQSWNVTVDILEQLAEISGDNIVDKVKLFNLFSVGMSSAEAGVLPPVCDGISCGTAQRSRISRAKAVIVIGADEGVLPSGKGKELLLSDDEIQKLKDESGIAIARTDSIMRSEEALGIYRTFSRASSYLWIGTAAADEKGESIKPSSVISSIRRIFPGLQLSNDIFATGNVFDQIEVRRSAADNMVRALRNAMDGEELRDEWKQALGWFKKEDLKTYENIKKGLLYSPGKKVLKKETVKELFRREEGDLIVSPSELEKFSRCPFAHFLQFGIGPHERRIHEIAPREIGDVYHSILMKIADELTVDGIPLTDVESPWMKISKEEFEKMARNICRDVVEEYKEGLLVSGAEEISRSERLVEIAIFTGWILVEHVRAGNIKEASFETRFGRNGELPPIIIEAEEENVYIEGVIDRLDILSNNRVKVIDYKTGSDSFYENEALSGWKLQLMIYLKAGSDFDETRKPAGVFYFHITDPVTDMTGKGRKDIKGMAGENATKSFILDGAVIDDAESIRSIAGDFESRSSIIPIRISKGEFKDNGTRKRLFTDEEFSYFQDRVNDTIKKACEGILNGDIDIRPKKKKKGNSACTYCNFSGICGFDTSFDECRYDFI